MSNVKSVIVCGGGIVGLCCAYHLAREGHRVTVLERGPADRNHCAVGSAGCVLPGQIVPLVAPGVPAQGFRGLFDPRSPVWVRPRIDSELVRWTWLFWRSATRRRAARSAPILRELCRDSRALFEEFDDIAGHSIGLTRDGVLQLHRTEEGLAHAAGNLGPAGDRNGVEACVLDVGQVAALNPGVRLDVAGGIFFPTAAHLVPARFIGTLTGLLVEMGVRLQWNTTVYGWHVDRDRLAAVHTTAGELLADEFVLAAGAGSPSLLTGLGLRLPLQAGKGYSLTLDHPRLAPRFPLMFAEARLAATPLDGSLRIGGALEFGGLDGTVRPERVRQMIAAASQYCPDLAGGDFAGIVPWVGLRPVAPDGLPYLGRFRRYRNLVAATGHAMLGVTLGPITGRLVAELVAGRTPSVPLERLSPDRFA